MKTDLSGFSIRHKSQEAQGDGGGPHQTRTGPFCICPSPFLVAALEVNVEEGNPCRVSFNYEDTPFHVGGLKEPKKGSPDPSHFVMGKASQLNAVQVSSVCTQTNYSHTSV